MSKELTLEQKVDLLLSQVEEIVGQQQEIIEKLNSYGIDGYSSSNYSYDTIED